MKAEKQTTCKGCDKKCAEPYCQTCLNKIAASPFKTLCLCGNTATRRVGGRREYQCERCHELAHNYYRNNPMIVGKGKRAEISWPSIGGLAYLQ